MRVTAAAGIVLAGLLSLVGSAAAAPAAPIGQWVSAGAQVNLGERATWYSDREQRRGRGRLHRRREQVKVRGYFGQGEDVLTGWTSAKNVKVVGWTPRRAAFVDRITS